jgi:hypothetical protein
VLSCELEGGAVNSYRPTSAALEIRAQTSQKCNLQLLTVGKETPRL